MTEDMPQRVIVPPPSEQEQLRQLAESMADIHYVCAIIVENSKKFVPGESVEELTKAWFEARPTFDNFVTGLGAPPAPPPRRKGGGADVAPSFDLLRENGLLGDEGRAKRGVLGRLKDRFFRFWNSEPLTKKNLRKAAEAAVDYLEYGSTVVSSIKSALGGYGEALVELLKLFKQLISLRLKPR
jgi:hypothetical protein